ncbi:MAG: UDP-N-acetylglucosamine--N-acetylmuramyl-(pentapeptide) pyrophosphoryl-undecaprenol N-acetylglucosamine transferase [Acidimicrobiia bacterium]
MSYLIAAAGTGGHVFPGLSVAEALVDLGAHRDQVLFVGGDRLESEVYPAAGYPFLRLDVRGLRRRLTPANMTLPLVVLRARHRIKTTIRERGVKVAMGMGGYVTIPAGWAAASEGLVFMNAEQNAEAGLANRVAARWASRTFGAFPVTRGLPGAEWVGNPVRREFRDFDREELRPNAMSRYGLSGERPVLGVFGGSLGARTLNVAVSEMVATWDGPEMEVVHLTGREASGIDRDRRASGGVSWVRIGFEAEMASFYAACDLVVARAGGAVAELTATATPAVLVPGRFGSGGHQAANARVLTKAGATATVPEEAIDDLPRVVGSLIGDHRTLAEMRAAAAAVARPNAAVDIAAAMMEAAA